MFVGKQFTVLAYLPHAQGKVHLRWEPCLAGDPIHLLLPPSVHSSTWTDLHKPFVARLTSLFVMANSPKTKELSAPSPLLSNLQTL